LQAREIRNYAACVLFFFCFLEKFSLNFWIKEYVKLQSTGRQHLKAPRWVSESYQLYFLLLGIIIYCEKVFLCSFMFVVGYRLFEIANFTFNWIFVHKINIHDSRRSLLSFVLNTVEIAIYFKIIRIFYDHKDIALFLYVLEFLKVDPLGFKCNAMLTALELFFSILLYQQ